MRDPTRMPPVLQALKVLWEKYPDMRLCQLMVSINGCGRDAFYLEDDELLRQIREILRNGF